MPLKPCRIPVTRSGVMTLLRACPDRASTVFQSSKSAWTAELEAFGHVLDVETFGASGTWTRPDNCTGCYVEVTGGGGSGAPCASAAAGQVARGSSSAWVTVDDGLGETEEVEVWRGQRAKPAWRI